MMRHQVRELRVSRQVERRRHAVYRQLLAQAQLVQSAGSRTGVIQIGAEREPFGTGLPEVRLHAETDVSLTELTVYANRVETNGNLNVLGALYTSGNAGMEIGSPVAWLHVHGANPSIRLSGAAANQALGVEFWDNNATRVARLLYAGGPWRAAWP